MSFSLEREFLVETQSQSICVPIQITDDAILEDEETFYVTIVASPPVKSFAMSLAPVIIEDDDSENDCYTCIISMVFTFINA